MTNEAVTPPTNTPSINAEAVAAAATDATKAGSQSGKEVLVSNVGELRSASPEFFKMLTESIANTIRSGMQQHAERMKKIRRENEPK